MKWSFFASGFRESRGSHTGTKANSRLVRDKYQSGDCAVIYVEYMDAPKQYARDVASQWTPGDTITVCGYSWGCGCWVRRFLWELWRLNPSIIVQHILLVDPVVYTKWYSFRWLAVSDWGTIKLPENVQCCSVFYQREDEPNASRVLVGGDVPNDCERLYVRHTLIDNAPEVTERVLEIAAKYLA